MAKIATSQARNGSPKTSAQSQNADSTAEIQQLAYQFFVERGYEHGHDAEDWLRAEAAVRRRRQ